ncbi:MAG: polysaccharide deacetylase family protein [bacterium]
MLLALVDWRWAAFPLIAYIAFTLAAPFFPRCGYFLPIISRGPRTGRQVALTFDDGPHPQTTTTLLELLDRHGVQATFFVVGRQAEAHPELIREILARGHELGNHSQSHDPLLMLRGNKTLHDELQRCQAALLALGVRTFAFRPPAGITNPRLRRSLQALGLFCVNFSCRARDRGNRAVDHLAARVLGRVTPGDIVLLHDCPPRVGVAPWLTQLDQLLRGLQDRQLEATGLGTLIGRPVCTQTDVGSTDSPYPVRIFYDGLARCYDAEQELRAMSLVRRAEQRCVLERISRWKPTQALEIGTGSGRFTLPLAQVAEQVTAVDVSPEMLKQLTEKAARERVDNIETVLGDVSALALDRRYSHICSFSAFEYIAELRPLIRGLADRLEPGGELYFTTARRSVLRFVGQLGNGLRQGLWLHARGRREVKSALAAAGLELQELNSHALGLLLEVRATKREAGLDSEEQTIAEVALEVGIEDPAG